MIDYKIFNVTDLATNCVYLIDKETGCNAVVDPGAKSDKLIEQINADGGKLTYVLLTHGHYDHITFAKQLADMFGAMIITGKANAEFLFNSTLNLTAFHNINLEPFKADVYLEDGDTFMIGKTKVKYISTPGHTKGCGCYITDKLLICGDTLFCESYGRTDLPTGNNNDMVNSIKKLKQLEGDYIVIPGHGPTSTLEHEKKYNPLMSRV